MAVMDAPGGLNNPFVSVMLGIKVEGNALVLVWKSERTEKQK